ncbi:uncharacterized protein LOC144316026 [Canis aureus]
MSMRFSSRENLMVALCSVHRPKGPKAESSNSEISFCRYSSICSPGFFHPYVAILLGEPELENIDHTELKSIHTGCFLLVLESAICFTPQAMNSLDLIYKENVSV